MTISPDNVKHYLKAITPEGLKSLMIANNFKAGKYYRYDIIFANGFWFAWYEEVLSEIALEKYATIDGRKGQRGEEV